MIADVPRCTRICSVSGKEIPPGQIVYSVLLEEEEEYRRVDFSQENWTGTASFGPSLVGWWKTRIPQPNDKKAKLAPNDVLLKLFDQLEEQLDKQEMRYMLTLLLIRRRLFRTEREEECESGKKMIVYCPKRDCSYEVFSAEPEETEIEQLQNELANLLS